MSAAFKDHFSGHAAAYRASRPTYPPELFAWLAAHAPGSPDRRLAVDLGCGNGQATVGLADLAARVIALDPSAEQIAQAEPHPRIAYRVAPAEATGLPAGTADLILAAQAFHWFDHERLFPELRRIAAPGALFAAATYATWRIDPAIDAVVHRLYEDILGPDWPAERRHVEASYRTLPFPLPELPVPLLTVTMAWDLARFRDYLGSWSALQRWQRREGRDPRALIDADLAAA